MRIGTVIAGAVGWMGLRGGRGGRTPSSRMLRTERLLLRPARVSDADALHPMFCDAEAMRYWSRPPHETLAQTEDWLASMRAIRAHEGEDFVVEHEGRVIGKAGLHRFPEIGFIFARPYWGRGLAAEALRAVVGRAFDHHRLEAVTADVDPRNARCLGLLARLGFAETHRAERTWNVGGAWCDSVYLRLDRGAWGARPG